MDICLAKRTVKSINVFIVYILCNLKPAQRLNDPAHRAGCCFIAINTVVGIRGFNPSTARCINFTRASPQPGSTVITGKIANGQQIPLPYGYSPNQCQWSVSNSENPHGWKPNYYAGSVAYADPNRIVKCGYYDEFNFHAGTNRADLSGKCSYIVSCH